MKFLLLGYGSIGKRHAAILRGMGHEVVTVDPDPAAGADWQMYAQPSEMAWDGLFDCTPPDVRNGWWTPGRYRAHFVEKPLGRPWVQSSLPVMMGFCYRWDKSLAEFVGIIKRQAIYSLKIVGGQPLQDWHTTDYREHKDRYRGVITDSLPHSIYIARWILGDVELRGAAVGKVSTLEINVEDVAGVLLAGPNNQPCFCLVDYMRDPRQFYVRAVTSGGVYQWEFCARDVDIMYQRQMEAWVALCKGELEDDYPTLADGIAVQEILDGVRRASH